MRLDKNETAQLGKQTDVVIWRWGPTQHCDLGHCYTSNGRDYTVIRRETMTRSDVLRKLGVAVYRALAENWHGEQPVEKITLRNGDHTDRPRFMHRRWSPTTGDYTTIRSQASEDAEVVSQDWLDKFAKDAADGIAEANQAHANRVADARRARSSKRLWPRQRAHLTKLDKPAMLQKRGESHVMGPKEKSRP